MGVNQGKKIFHKIESIGLPQLVTVLRDLRPPAYNESQPLRWPCVIIDGNWICNRVNTDLVHLLDIAEAFVAQGINIFFIFDGLFWHHSKWVSIKCSAIAEKAHIKAIQT